MPLNTWDDRADALALDCLEKKTGAAWQNFVAYCLKMGYIEKFPVHYNQCVCAPTNRDSYGCNGYDTHENISDITSAGWSDGYFDGIITDIDPSEREAVLTFNEDMVASSKGQLAPIVRELIKFMTYAGSHTTQGLRQQKYLNWFRITWL